MKVLDIPELTPEQQVLFWSKVDRHGPMPDQSNPHYKGLDRCWIWTKGKVGRYGRTAIGKKLFLANRIAYTLAIGKIPEDRPFVLYKCDNGCCNPAHLWAGTGAENVADAERKNRGNHPTGDRNVSRTRPDMLVRGEAHHAKSRPECLSRGDRHWTKTNPERIPRGSQSGRAKLTDSIVSEMRERHSKGERIGTLRREFGVTHRAAMMAVNRLTWRYVP